MMTSSVHRHQRLLPTKKQNDYRLYLVTDDRLDDADLFRVVQDAAVAGVSMIQLREKERSTRAFLERAMTVKRLLQGSHIPLIINDRIDIALAVDADGVHLGQSDMPVILARQLLGPDKIIGLSVESETQLREAGDLPVDYIGLSAVFPTPTKQNTVYAWGLSGLRWARQHYHQPIVAIGGINLANIQEVIRAGADGIAVVSAICQAPDPAAAVRTLKACWQQDENEGEELS